MTWCRPASKPEHREPADIRHGELREHGVAFSDILGGSFGHPDDDEWADDAAGFVAALDVCAEEAKVSDTAPAAFIIENRVSQICHLMK